jgi:uncharacterized YigZ family protein
MLFDDTYKTIQTTSEGIFRDKGSKFIAYVFPIKNEAEVKVFINNLKNEHPKARHFCSALRLTPDRNIFKVNDDGEPSGTAGRPILNTLLSADVTDILVVVVRYFGGTLLGVPGLINAYKTATIEALKANVVISKTLNDLYEIHFDYESMNDVMRIIKEEELTVVAQQFDNNCIIKLEIRKADLNVVLIKLGKIDGLISRYLSTN